MFNLSFRFLAQKKKSIQMQYKTLKIQKIKKRTVVCNPYDCISIYVCIRNTAAKKN